MNRRHRRQYEMLLRVRDFGNAHSHLFSESGLGKEAIGCINAAIDELTTTDLMKRSASEATRADRQAAARKTLTDLLVKVSQLARVLRARGKPVPAFDLPVSRSNQELLTAARQFARDAAGFDADFRGHSLGSKAIAAAAAAFETATRDRGMSQADHVAANTRIRDLLAAALLDAKRLDLIVDTELVADNVARAVWKQARRVMKGRTAGGSEVPDADEAEAPVAAETRAAHETPVAAEAPAPMDPLPPAPVVDPPPLPAL